MNFGSNEEFLEYLEKEFPGKDWSHSPKERPKIYVVNVQNSGKWGPEHFTVGKEYKTYNEAFIQLKVCGGWKNVIPGTLEVRAQMSEEEFEDRFFHESWKKVVQDGQKCFPMFLP